MSIDEIKKQVPHKPDCKNNDVWCYHHPTDTRMTLYRCESCKAEVVFKFVGELN